MRTLKIKITCIKTDHTGQDDTKEYFANVKAGEQLNIDYEKLAGYKVVTLEAVEEKVYLVLIKMFEQRQEIFEFKNLLALKEILDRYDSKNIYYIGTDFNGAYIQAADKTSFINVCSMLIN